jgi:fibronectin-binding autotransporter adhesin
MKPLLWKYSPVASIFVAFTLVGAPAAHAANTTWVGNTDANFSTLANWNSVTPNGNTPVFGVAGSSGTTLNNDISGGTYVGLTFSSGASAYTIGGNSFTLTGNIANNSTSTQTINTDITLSGARTIAATSGQLVFGGNITGNAGNTTLTPTNKITLAGTNSLTLSANFAGFNIGAGAGGVDITGSTTIDGAAGNQQSGYLSIAGTTTVTVQSGGSFAINGTTNATKPNSIVGQNAAGTSTLLVNGGSLTIGGNTGFGLGNNINTATGVLTISSGTATITAGSATLQNLQNYVSLGRDNANGVINLSGGTLATGRQFVRDGSAAGTVGAGTATFNFDGGILQAQADQTSGNGWFETTTTGNFQVVTTVVKAGGAKIDTNGFNTNINTVLAHDSGLGATLDGGLIKSGTGILTLGGASTYTGATLINAGTLALSSTGSIASTQITNASGATFDVSAVSGYTLGSGKTLTNNGTVNGSFTVASGGTLNGSGTFNGAVTVDGALNPGNSPGSQTFASGLTLGAASTTTMEVAGLGGVAGTDFDFINVTGGTMTNDGSLAIVDFGGFDISAQTGTFNLFDFVTGTGDFDAVTVDGNSLTFNGGTDEWNSTVGDVTYNFAEGTGVLSVTVVPEPTAALLGGIGLLGLLRRRRVA